MESWLFGFVSDPWSVHLAYALMAACLVIGTAFGFILARAGCICTWLGR